MSLLSLWRFLWIRHIGFLIVKLMLCDKNWQNVKKKLRMLLIMLTFCRYNEMNNALAAYRVLDSFFVGV